jgi:hypothetical protein
MKRNVHVHLFVRTDMYAIYFQMEKLDEASNPDVPYPYDLIAKANAARVNRYLPQPIVSNLS